MNYSWKSYSPTSTEHWLGYHTEEEANNHTKIMNSMLKNYDTDKEWNKTFWGSKPPQPWITEKI